MNLNLDPVFLFCILVAVSIHECAHALAAHLLGDSTAKDQGRLTVNPIAHLDPMGTLLFFLVGFGWGKPVPVDSRYFKRPLWDSALVALAGPVSNIIIAFLSIVGLIILDKFSPEPTAILKVLSDILHTSVGLNLGLMAFNLLPFPPLDGSRVIEALLPWRARTVYLEFAQYSQWIVFGLIIAENFLHIPILSWWVINISNVVLTGFEFVLKPVL